MHRLRIRDLREDADKTQTEIAEILGIKQTVYSRYEVGKNLIPLYHLITLAEHYNVSLDYICGLTNQKKPLTGNAPRYTDNGNHDQERQTSI